MAAGELVIGSFFYKSKVDFSKRLRRNVSIYCTIYIIQYLVRQ